MMVNSLGVAKDTNGVPRYGDFGWRQLPWVFFATTVFKSRIPYRQWLLIVLYYILSCLADYGDDGSKQFIAYSCMIMYIQ